MTRGNNLKLGEPGLNVSPGLSPQTIRAFPFGSYERMALHLVYLIPSVAKLN